MTGDFQGGRAESRFLLPVLFDGSAGAVLGVGMVRLTSGEDGTGAQALWVERFDVFDEARARFEWMLMRPERWPVWMRTLAIVGGDAFSALLLDEVRVDALRVADQRCTAERLGRRASQITLARERDGHRHTVALRRLDEVEPFLLIAMDDPIERDRVWDWVRWRRGRYGRWRAIAKQRGSAAVIRAVVRAMLRDEMRLKAAGLAAAGRRPLRLWRGGSGLTGISDDDV
jgi:hypothetical protein